MTDARRRFREAIFGGDVVFAPLVLDPLSGLNVEAVSYTHLTLPTKA
mgnify:CR=1 FL=1